MKTDFLKLTKEEVQAYYKTTQVMKVGLGRTPRRLLGLAGGKPNFYIEIRSAFPFYLYRVDMPDRETLLQHGVAIMYKIGGDPSFFDIVLRTVESLGRAQNNYSFTFMVHKDKFQAFMAEYGDRMSENNDAPASGGR